MISSCMHFPTNYTISFLLTNKIPLHGYRYGYNQISCVYSSWRASRGYVGFLRAYRAILMKQLGSLYVTFEVVDSGLLYSASQHHPGACFKCKFLVSLAD